MDDEQSEREIGEGRGEGGGKKYQEFST